MGESNSDPKARAGLAKRPRITTRKGIVEVPMFKPEPDMN